MGADHLRKVAGYDFHDLRRKYDVRTMWGDLDPQWRLLQSQLVARGPGWYSPAELKERLFTNTVGGLGSEGDKTVLLGPKNWNPISSSKCTVLACHG